MECEPELRAREERVSRSVCLRRLEERNSSQISILRWSVRGLWFLGIALGSLLGKVCLSLLDILLGLLLLRLLLLLLLKLLVITWRYHIRGGLALDWWLSRRKARHGPRDSRGYD